MKIWHFRYKCRDCGHEFEITPPQDVICRNCWNYNLQYLGKQLREEEHG